MGYWKIIPEELIDWIEEKTSNPERYHRLVNYLIRIVNWGDGTYHDGVEVKKGEKRISINKLAKKLNYSYGSTWEMLKTLEKAGWISIFSQYKLTIISLNWLKHCDTKTDNRFSKFPITKTENPDNKPDNKSDNIKASATNSKTNLTDNKTDNKSDSKTSDSRYQNQAQADIRNNTNSIEIKQKEIIRREIKEGRNNKASPENSESDFEEKKEKLKEFKEEVKKEIKESSDSKEESESKEEDEAVTDAHIRASVERIKEVFIREYAKKFNRPPYISVTSVNKIFKDFKESYKTCKKLKEAETHLIEKIPDFFSLTDEWIRKKGYSFFAFSWRIGDLLSEPVKPKYCGSYTNKEFSLTEAMPW